MIFMTTVTLTEHNRNSSGVLRLADFDDVYITERGVPTYKITRVSPPPDDRLDSLIRGGIFSPPTPVRIPRQSALSRAQAAAAIAAFEADGHKDGYDY
jgi:antitoxin (DNA-binding transcriptional repressor) of toxin-antitoxin stability system